MPPHIAIHPGHPAPPRGMMPPSPALEKLERQARRMQEELELLRRDVKELKHLVRMRIQNRNENRIEVEIEK